MRIMTAGEEMSVRNKSEGKNSVDVSTRRGMVLPFTPLSLAFNHVNYYVDMPAVSAFFSYYSNIRCITIHTWILPFEYLLFINCLNLMTVVLMADLNCLSKNP